MLTWLDKAGRPGWIICDPRDGKAHAWVPFTWCARLLSRRAWRDYVRPGDGW